MGQGCCVATVPKKNKNGKGGQNDLEKAPNTISGEGTRESMSEARGATQK